MIHVSGYFPSGLHIGSKHSADIILGHTFNTAISRFEVKGNIIPLLESHPLVLSLKALEADGYKVNRQRLMSYKRWTISKGIPLMNTLDLRTGTVYVDGNFRQLENAEGRWCSGSGRTGNPGKDAKERAQREAAARIPRAYDQEGAAQ